MRIGVIGLGGRIGYIVSEILGYNLGVKLAAVCDINKEKAKEKVKGYGIPEGEVNYYDVAEDILDSEKLDGVLIGTRCSMHAGFAVKVLERRIPLFLEKPVATNIKDLLMLKKAYEENNSPVVVSFPLRVTAMVNQVKEIIESGEIGEVNHAEAFNYVPYGGVYYHNWYRDEDETGGLFLQKATHDLDYLTYLIGKTPKKLCAMASKQIFKGDMPAGLHCKDCAKNESCMESPYYIKRFAYDDSHGDMCCFAKDTGNEDSGSVIIRYEGGMHAVYTQNFFARKDAAKRGAILSGYKGTVEFDWYKDEIKVYKHHLPVSRTYKYDSKVMSHFGGDSALTYNFINIMRNNAKSISPLDAGLLSALLCLKAKESSLTDEYVEVKWD